MTDLFSQPPDAPARDNVFEHQRFCLRTPDGARVSKSLREILTEPDAAYALDYAQPFYDVSALGLMAYLAQVAFEPDDPATLAGRLDAPMSEADFETAIAPLRAAFALDGDGSRFMQAPAPFDEKKAEGLDVAVFIAPKGDRKFLHRSDADWAVAPDQAGLFLFSRNTFYEAAGGSGYQKGTNGDTPIRVLVTDPAGDGFVWLRRTVWLNVLSRQQQSVYAGAYGTAEAGAYDGRFWTEPLPAKTQIPVGGLTLRAGLGWMTAYHWLWYEDAAEGVCPLTGERVAGRAARRTSKRSTGVSYGAKGDQENDVRAERLFRHPNVPTRRLYDKAGDAVGEQPFLVQRTEGLAQAVGAAAFGDVTGVQGSPFMLAPVVAQLSADPLRRWFSHEGRKPGALVFGFHMLGNQKSIHGGVEQSAFRLPLVGETPFEAMRLLAAGALLVRDAGAFARTVANELKTAVQRTAGAGVRAKVDPESGAIKVDGKLASTPSVDDPFGRDTLAAFWRAVQQRLIDHTAAIAAAAEGGADALDDAAQPLQTAWETAVVAEAKAQYRPVFEHYSVLARTMPFAHTAQRWFNTNLKKARSTAPVAPSPDPS